MRWLVCLLGVVVIALAVKVGSFFVIGRLDADQVAERLAAKHGAATTRALCSGPQLVNGFWDAFVTPWASFRYSCPEDAGDGQVDLVTVTVRHGRITAIDGSG